MDAPGRCGRAAQAIDLSTIVIEQGDDAPRGNQRLIGSFLDAVEKKREPCLPIPGGPHSRQQIVVDLSMRLEEQAQVHDRLAQSTGGAEPKRDEQPPEPSIPIEKRMDRFELRMNEAGLNQNRDFPPLFVEQKFELPN